MTLKYKVISKGTNIHSNSVATAGVSNKRGRMRFMGQVFFETPSPPQVQAWLFMGLLVVAGFFHFALSRGLAGLERVIHAGFA